MNISRSIVVLILLLPLTLTFQFLGFTFQICLNMFNDGRENSQRFGEWLFYEDN